MDSKTQAYLDDFLTRKKAVLKAARAAAAAAPPAGGGPPPPAAEELDAAVEAEFAQVGLLD